MFFSGFSSPRVIAATSSTHSAIRLDFEASYREHHGVVWQTLRHLGVSERDARDVCQNVFLTAYNHQTEFEGRSTVKTWLIGIAKWMASDYRDRAMFRREVLVDEPPYHTGAEATQFQHLEQRERLAQLESVLSEMKPERRDVFVLFEIEELRAEDIAQIIGIPEGTVRSRLSKARQEFSRILATRQNEPFRVDPGGHP